MLVQTAVATAQNADLGIRGTDNLVARLNSRYGDRITGYFRLPAKAARHAPFPDNLSSALIQALASRGISELYSHQREAWDALAGGDNVVVVTPTASGKSLCYHLPVIEAVRQSRAKALYLFPTKALAQDQVAELLELNHPGGIGLSEPLFLRAPQLVADARGLVARCECKAGCPACIGPILASDEGRRSPREIALAVLDLLA